MEFNESIFGKKLWVFFLFSGEWGGGEAIGGIASIHGGGEDMGKGRGRGNKNKKVSFAYSRCVEQGRWMRVHRLRGHNPLMFLFQSSMHKAPCYHLLFLDFTHTTFLILKSVFPFFLVWTHVNVHYFKRGAHFFL